MIIETINITAQGDIYRAKSITKEFATTIGFAPHQIEELMITISELASNILRHAGQGKLIISTIDATPQGIQLESIDQGPGIGDVEQAIADGFSTAGSLGYGLGAINRLMDTLDIQSLAAPDTGLYVQCTKRVPALASTPLPCPFSIGISTRPYLGLEVNGDAYLSIWSENSLLIGVIDGLGHGPFAYQAAQKIKQYVISHSKLSLDLIFKGAGRVSREGRGGVMALCRLTREQQTTTLNYASVGNIEGRIIGRENQNLPVVRGILGKSTMVPKVHTQSLRGDDSLALFSDGLSSRWSQDVYQGFSDGSAKEISQNLLAQLGKDNDDATIVVVKHYGAGGCV